MLIDFSDPYYLGAMCFFVGVFCGYFYHQFTTSCKHLATQKKPAKTSRKSHPDYKLVLCVRTDLKMTKGKACAQCGHATLGAYLHAVKTDPDGVEYWRKYGQAKITLKVPNEAEMDALEAKALSENLPAHIIADAGKTQIAAGSKTVLAIGPAPVEQVNKVTQHLKLY